MERPVSKGESPAAAHHGPPFPSHHRTKQQRRQQKNGKKSTKKKEKKIGKSGSRRIDRQQNGSIKPIGGQHNACFIHKHDKIRPYLVLPSFTFFNRKQKT